MKRITMLSVLIAVFCLVAAGVPSHAAESDYKYHWKLATTETADYYMTVLAQDFINRVNKRTNGKVTGQVFHSGQIGNLVDALEGLELGNVDIVMDGLSSLGAINRIFDAWGLPYLYDSKEHQYRVWDQHFDTIADLIAKECGIRIVTVIDGLNRELSSTVPVNSIEDLKGLKIRVPTIPAYLRIWECFGAAPVPMAFSEVYTAIQTGVVEGQENDIPLTLSMNFYEVAKYCVLTHHVAYEGSLYFNDEKFNSYPKELQQIIKEVGAEIIAESRSMIKDIETKAMAKLDELGITVLRPDLAPFKEAVKPMYAEYSYCKPITDLVDAAR